jgi:hypothetical protein
MSAPALAAVRRGLRRLAEVDAAALEHRLSPENARACWAAALEGIGEEALAGRVEGTAPRAVLFVGSANVFTAPVSWCAMLAARGVSVRLKPAREQRAVADALAGALPGVSVHAYEGGDLAAEGAALAGVDGLIAMGRAATVSALRARVDAGVRFVGLGPKFGASFVDRLTPEAMLDHALYDGRGCMSPAMVFAREIDLDAIAALCADAERAFPRGTIEPADAAAIRARVALGRALGEVRVAPGEPPAWAVVAIPAEHATPIALPRVLMVHEVADRAAAIHVMRPWMEELGTWATDLAGGGNEALPGHVRRCAPGQMQRPPASRFHDGIDVLGALWAAGE